MRSRRSFPRTPPASLPSTSQSRTRSRRRGRSAMSRTLSTRMASRSSSRVSRSSSRCARSPSRTSSRAASASSPGTTSFPRRICWTFCPTVPTRKRSSVTPPRCTCPPRPSTLAWKTARLKQPPTDVPSPPNSSPESDRRPAISSPPCPSRARSRFTCRLSSTPRSSLSSRPPSALLSGTTSSLVPSGYLPRTRRLPGPWTPPRPLCLCSLSTMSARSRRSSRTSKPETSTPCPPTTRSRSTSYPTSSASRSRT
mmetsp:Transcript_14406/g.26551  ORF Transcript_14406/g.26551 Transcript_14406/m.26551 type:complete len:254 (+) Transcript_14406:3233-3994(+)